MPNDRFEYIRRTIQDNIETNKSPLKDFLSVIENERFYIVGGYISSLAISKIYGIERPKTDLDILFKEKTDLNLIKTPTGWKRTLSTLGNFRLVNGEHQIDIWDLTTTKHILELGLEPTIESYLSIVPFTLQSLVYDFESRKVIGDIGLNAIHTQTVGVNNLSNAEPYYAKFRMSVNEAMQKFAAKYNFTPLLID